MHSVNIPNSVNNRSRILDYIEIVAQFFQLAFASSNLFIFNLSLKTVTVQFSNTRESKSLRGAKGLLFS